MAALLLAATAVQAQTLPSVPVTADIKVATGGAQPVITAPDANTLDVDLKATRTVINWDSFHVSAADSVTFHFGATSDIVLNKSPTQVKVDAGGHVTGLVGAASGGNIWFYSPGGVVISPGAVMTAGNFLFARGDAIVDLDFVDATSPLSVLRSASDSLIQIDTITSATSASINAQGDLVLSAATGDIDATTALGGKSATVTATTGAVSIGEVTASNGTASVTASGGAATVGSLNGSDGASATASTSVSVTSASSSGGDIVLTGATSASLGSGAAGRDLKVLAPAASLGGGSAGRDVLVTATTGAASVTGAVTAGGDIEVTATTGSVTAGSGSLTSTGSASGAHHHVLAKSTSGAVTVGSAATQGVGGSAEGDVTISGATSATLTSGSSTRDLTVSGTTATLGSATVSGDVFVTATTGNASVTGAVSAGDDVEVTATTGSVTASGGSLTSTGANNSGDAHVLAKSTGGAVDVGSAATQGTGSAAGDITITGATTAALGTGSSSADIHVTGPTASLGSADAAGDVFVAATTGSATVTGNVTAGDDIEVTAGAGSVTTTGGTLTATGANANGDAHVLAKSTGGSVRVTAAATQGTHAAAGDITVDAATTASLGSGSATGAINVTGPTASLGSGDAAGDVFVTATTGSASVTGTVTAGDDIEITATTGSVTAGGGSLTSTGAGANGDAHVLAKSTGGAVTVGSATTQGTGADAGDVTLDAATTASLGSGHSSRDITVTAPTASLGSGSAARDILVTATTGSASVTGAISAGDDIEITATTGSVTASGGSLTSTGAGANGDAHVLVKSTGGTVNVGVAATQGAGSAAGDVTVDGAAGAVLNSGSSSRDIQVLGPTAGLGDGAAARSVLVTATTGTANVTGTVTAGDDIEVTATTGAVMAVGSLTSTGDGASGDAHVLARSTSGAVTVGSAKTEGTGSAAGDVTIDGATTATLTGTAQASQDVIVQAGDSVAAAGSTIAAGRDATVKAGANNVTLGTVRAGDDIAVRAQTGAISGSGDLQAGTTHAGGDPDPSGAADTLAGATLAGHDIDLKAQTIAITGNVAAGRGPDNGETLGSAQLQSDVVAYATNPDAGGVAALRLATGTGKAVIAHQDINLKVDNAGGASIQAGGVSAGRDVAVYSVTGGITLGTALAGDDVVLRAPTGAIVVNGDVAAGRDSAGMTPTDSAGAGDDLNTAVPFIDFDGNPGTVFKVVGFDVSIVSQAVQVTGATIAGRQPSTDNPDAAGPVDATTSDVRIETRVSATPVLNLAPDITLGPVIATRDLQIDSAKAVTTGDLQAGRDIAVLGRGGVTPGAAAGDHSGSGVTIASAHAGDDALAFSVYGRTHVLGGVTAGAPFQRLVPTNDRNIDGATEAADQLAIYLHYFDLDDASSPYVLPGGVIHLFGQGVTVGGNLMAQGAGGDVRIRSALDIDVSGATSAGGLAVFQTDAVGGGSVKVGAVTAAGDVMLDGVGAQATGMLTSTGGDVAVRGRSGGAISIAGASAGDDVVLRTTGSVTITGPVSAGGGSDSAGAGDALRTSDGAVTLEGQSYDLAGHDVDIVGGSVTATAALHASGANGDVRVQSAGAIDVGDATAGRDVLVDGASTVSTGVLSAGRDVGVRSTGDGAGVTVGGASAGDDVVIRAKGTINVTGALSSGGGTDSGAGDQAGDLMFGAAKSNLGGDLDLTGQTVDVRSSAGSIVVGGATTAATDARFQTQAGTGGSVKVAAVTAGRDILLDGGAGGGPNGAQATGTLTTTTGDVAVRARDGKAIRLGAGASAGDDLVLRTTGSVTANGAVSAGGGTDSAGLGDTLRTLEGAISLEGQAFDLTGHDIDVTGASVTATGGLTAVGSGSDVRVQSAGAIDLSHVTAGRDVLVDGASTVSTGVLTAGRDVGVRSTGDGAAVTLGGASAGDDVVVRAKGDISVTGALSAGGGADSAAADQAGDLMFGAAKSRLGADLDLTGRNIDVRSSAGSIVVTGAANAAGDARFQTAEATGGSVKVGAVTAGRDVLLDGGAGAGANGAEATGTVTATSGDIAIRARDGKAIQVARLTAGDDVVLRATGAVSVSGRIDTGGGSDGAGLGDALTTTEGPVTLEGHAFDLAGHDVDIVGGSVTTSQTATAAGVGSDVRVQSGGAISLGDATADRDVLVDGGAAVSTGVLAAGRDVGVRSTGDGATVTVGGASAGDDVVIRAKGDIAINGDLSAGGGTDSAETDQAGDLMFGAAKSQLGGDLDLSGQTVDVRSSAGSIVATGAIAAAGDARLQTAQTTGGSVKVGAVTAGRDVLLDGGAGAGADGVEATGTLTATAGDVAVRARDGKTIRLAGVTAGDDVVLRGTGQVTVGGAVAAGGGTDGAGLGDALRASDGAIVLEGQAFDLTGHDVDISGGSVTATGALGAAGAGADVRVQSSGAINLAAATAARDVLVDGAGAVSTGLLTAGRDVGVRSTGDGATVAVGGATAGDDVVIRAKGDISITGVLNAGAGSDSNESDQAGDLIFGASATRLAGDLDLVGRTLDVRSTAGSITSTRDAVAATDARFQTAAGAGGSVKVASVMAGRDILLDGGAGAGANGVEAVGALTATTGDVAVRARDAKAIRLAGVMAGDDVALRAAGGISTTGVVTTTGGPSTMGVADRLTSFGEAGPLAVGGLTFDLGSSDIDVVGGTIDIFKTAARGSARIKAGSLALQGGAAVGVDILIDSDAALTVGDLSALGDIALRSRSGRLTVGKLTAGDDIVLRGAQGITTGALKAGGAGDHQGVGDQLFASDPTSLGQLLFNVQGGTIDLKTSGGSILLGSAEAAGDVRLQAATGDVALSGPVSAGRDILADGGSVTASGALTATGDVALQGRTGKVTVGSVSAGDDIVIRAAGDVLATGELKSGQGGAGDGVGDALVAATDPAALFVSDGQGEGGVIDVRGGTIELQGAITAAGDNAHLRLQSAGTTTLGDASLTGDIAIDAGGDVKAGALKAGRDIAVRSTGGALSIASGTAGDDIVLRASGGVSVTGPLAAGGRGEAFGAGDQLFGADRTALGGDFDLAGQSIDIKAGGDVSAGDRLTADGDIRIQAAGGTVTTADVKAGRDVLLDGGVVRAGAAEAGGDIAIRAGRGALTLGSARAGDDLVLRAAGDITLTGAASAGGGADVAGAGDRLFASDRSGRGDGVDLAGRHVDAKAGGAVEVQGQVAATDDIRLQAAGGVTVTGELAAGRDALLDGDAIHARDVRAGRDAMLDGGSVVAGDLRAGRDVAVRGRTGAVGLGSVAAGDDVVIRGARDITVTGAVTAQGADDGDGAADHLFAGDRTSLAGDLDLTGANIDIRGKGAIALAGLATAGRDARFQTVGDGAVALGEVKAGGDVLADGRDVTATGQLTAGRDIAVRARAGAVNLASLMAGDDIAIRASGAIKVTGALASGSGADAAGAADRLASSGEGGAISRLVDPLAATSAIEAFSLKSGDIDIKGGDAVTLGGDAAAAGSAGIRLQAATKLTVAGLTAGDGIFARASDLALDGPWRAMSARLEITASGGLALGEGVSAPSGGLALSTAQLGRIEAPTLQIFLGDTSGSRRGGALAIGALGVDTSKIRTSFELYAGGQADVAITGAFAPLGSGANTTLVRIGAPSAEVGDWTPKSIRIIANNGGSIGVSTTTGGRQFTDVRAFDMVELNAKGDILMGYQDFIDRLATTSAASVPGVVKSLIAPQTTSGPRILITAGALRLRADGKVAQQDTGGLLGSTPTGLYLLGASGGGPQLLLGRTTPNGAAGLPEFIELNGALTSAGTVMTGESVSLAAGILFDRGVSPSGYYRLNGCAILQQGDCMPSNGHPTIAIPPDQLTGLTLEDHTAAAGTADPTVASATNEEVWKDPN